MKKPDARRMYGRRKGFTLLEVLVALIFFSLIGMVLQQVTASVVGQYRQIELKTFGLWIAENKMAQLHINEKLPKARETKEDINFANLEWQLVSKVSETDFPAMRRVEIEVFVRLDDEPRKTFGMTGIVGRY